MLNVALPKGRLGERVYEIFLKAGYASDGFERESRKLIFTDEKRGVSYFWVKPSDVPIYVERGVADLGVAGKDVLLENSADVYELLDLKLGKCRMAIAAQKGYRDDTSRPLVVATKFVNITKDYYAGENRIIDVVKLSGSIELAPILGLSDVIVDIVETGTTLKENDLSVIKEILPVSARLIANKAKYKFKSDEIDMLTQRISKELPDD